MGRRVVVSSTASDSHTWNLVFLQLTLEEMGHQVTNLGPCVPDEMLVAACVAGVPELVVLSTVNGNGFRDGGRVIGKLRAEPALRDIPVVIGGKLGVAGPDPDQARRLLAAGFDAVFTDDPYGIASFQSFLAALPADRAVPAALPAAP
jgi:methylaspartate mutase sigma subunit